MEIALKITDPRLAAWLAAQADGSSQTVGDVAAVAVRQWQELCEYPRKIVEALAAAEAPDPAPSENPPPTGWQELPRGWNVDFLGIDRGVWRCVVVYNRREPPKTDVRRVTEFAATMGDALLGAIRQVYAQGYERPNTWKSRPFRPDIG